jgi:hypothetical protein
MLLVSCALGAQVNNPAPSPPSTVTDAKTLAEIQKLSAKIDSMASKADVQALLEAHLRVVDARLAKQKSDLVITWVLTQMATLGAAFGIFLWLKGQRRV